MPRASREPAGRMGGHSPGRQRLPRIRLRRLPAPCLRRVQHVSPGRFVGERHSALFGGPQGRWRPLRVLAAMAALLVFLNLGWISVVALFANFFLMSIMFPTIFGARHHGLGTRTKIASSFIVMSDLSEGR